MLRLDERFEVAADLDRVWGVLSSPRAVVDCVPGAMIVAEGDDGTFEVALGVKFGPVKIAFKSRVALELDHGRRVGTLSARGKDANGGTQMRATATFAATEKADRTGTAVAVDGTVELTGKLASVVEGGATVVIQRLSKEFAERLAARCAGGAPTANEQRPVARRD